jgi:2-polyprenyl-6-methoxyphenol hydroxylase-like FAD-dependent oxidoreductase
VDLPSFWGACGPCVGMPRAGLHRALSDGVAVTRGLEPTAVEAGPDAVAVTLSDGSRREVDLLVGADGIRSATRALLGDARPPRRVGQLSWRFVVELAGVQAWTALLGRGASFLLVPIGDRTVYCYADTDEPGELRALFGGYADPVPAALDRLGDPAGAYVSWIEEAVPPEPPTGRVEDALVLAEELKEHDTVPAALAAFAARRRPRTDWVRARAHRRDRTRGLPAPVRDTVLRLAGGRVYRADYRPLLGEP